MPVPGPHLGHVVQLCPQGRITIADAFGGVDRVVRVIVPAMERSQVGEPEGDVLDEDVEVERPLSVRESGVDLGGLGVDEERLDPVSIAPEQRIRQ